MIDGTVSHQELEGSFIISSGYQEPGTLRDDEDQEHDKTTGESLKDEW